MIDYYATCGTPSARESSFTVTTNLPGVYHVLLKCNAYLWVDTYGEECEWDMVVTLKQPGYYASILRIIEDCVQIENLLWNTELEELA
jgi:hypothetical protein